MSGDFLVVSRCWLSEDTPHGSEDHSVCGHTVLTFFFLPIILEGRDSSTDPRHGSNTETYGSGSDGEFEMFSHLLELSPNLMIANEA